LARSPSFTVDALLSADPEDVIYESSVLADALSLVPIHDHALLIHLARRVQVSAGHMPILQVAEVYSSLVNQLGRHKMYAALAPTVGAYFVRMDQAIRNREIDIERMQGLYKRILKAMHNFAEDEDRLKNRLEPLPDVVRVEVYRVVRRMVDDMERAPSSSTSQAASLDAGLLRVLSNRRLMSLSLAQLLFEHAGRSGRPLGPAVLHQCVMAAMGEGNAKLAQTLLRVNGKSLSRIARSEDTRDGDTPRVEDGHTKTDPRYALWKVKDLLARAAFDADLDDMSRWLLPYLQTREDVSNHDLGSGGGTLPLTDEQHLQTMRYAWSMLLNRAGKHPGVTTSHMLDLYATMPEAAGCAHTLTPIMNALLALDDADVAWKIWLDALDKERSSGQPGRFVDHVTLAVASEICGRREGLDAAVRLVDQHAVRVKQLELQPDRRPASQTTTIDTQNVNILIREAASARSPSTAFRLWTASRPRWGARMNGFSLGLLMNAARICEYSPPNDPDGFVDDVNTRWRLLLSEMDPRSHFRADEPPKENEKYRQYEEDGFSKGDAGVLLDPPGYKWYTAYGTYRPWQRARHIFRQVVLDNWPFLRAVKSPLTVQSGFLGFASWGGSLPASPPIEHATTLPLPEARYMHIIPTPGTWQAYIQLLGTFSRVQEIPLALAWMKELGVKPERTTMLIALTFVREVEGPRRLIKNWTAGGGSKLVRDEEILRKWLEEWLRDGTDSKGGAKQPVVPTEDEVWNYRGWMSMKRRRLVL
jgi:hypothetical protein